MKKKGYYSSGEFARMAHISVRTVRYYDKINILNPSHVNENGARFYTDEDLVRLQQILLLKYLGFSLEDIKMLTVEDADYQMLCHSLELQLKLVRERIEQMQLVEKAIEDTTRELATNKNIDWSQMLNLIHLTNMENSLKMQYQNSNNISARIHLHKLYSQNKQGWFPWIFEQCQLQDGWQVLDLGCGSGSLWKENYSRIPPKISVVLNDISEGMLRDTRREIDRLCEEAYGSGKCDLRFEYDAFDCHQIPYSENQFDLILANHVLFYCEDIDKVLGEIYRVLKPGGIFIGSTYGKNHMKEITELVQLFQTKITLSAQPLYEKFGLDNGKDILQQYFLEVQSVIYDDMLVVTKPENLIEYILSCHGNQNQYILDKYKDFYEMVEKKTKKGFKVTKNAGIFICRKDIGEYIG